MKQVTLFAALIMTFSLYGNAQNKKEQDQEAIKKMCGCYEVSFDFAETFEYSNDTTYVPSEVKHDKGLEWVELVEDAENKIVLQHLLIVGRSDKQSVIKHWRQDWLYENTELYMFDVNNKWNYTKLNEDAVKGQWTQKVFQVDDSPRYEGSASWVHIDGKSYWENSTDAPLPRREYTKRDDYNLTVRRNRHEIVAEGWIHDQDNDKVVRIEGYKDKVLAQEKGLNTYRKVDGSKCKIATNWWKENKETWSLVRLKWDDIFNQNVNLELKPKVDGKPLYRFLFSDEFSGSKEDISKTIESFIKE
jgi:hypothetical protein